MLFSYDAYFLILTYRLVLLYYYTLITIYNREVYVLYGSQTGNAESIANEFYKKCEEKRIPSKFQTLNSIKKVDMKDKASLLVVVISTTGNGDSPENSEAFWRSIKLRSCVSSVVVLLMYSLFFSHLSVSLCLYSLKTPSVVFRMQYWVWVILIMTSSVVWGSQ